MKLAVNYSAPAADLLQAGEIQIDAYKCPAWPDLIERIRVMHPLYIHFPLRIGQGTGDALDTETGRPADWQKVEALLAETGTPMVNLHLEPKPADYPHIPPDTRAPAHFETLVRSAIRDVRSVCQRFGPERVLIENHSSARGTSLRPIIQPRFLSRVVEETGCGLLLDISHARLAAHYTGIDARQYIAQLPTAQIREIHLAGIQRFEGRWLEMALEAGIDDSFIARYNGYLLDHLPMTAEDWDFAAWAMAQVHCGAWAEPWVATFEYGGIGRFWEMVGDRDVLGRQVPRLHQLVKAGTIH